MKSYFDILLNLPADETLRIYLEKLGVELPPDFEWSEDAATSHRLMDWMGTYPDVAVRDRIMAELKMCAQFDSPKAREIMLQVCAFDASVLVGLIACRSELHRAFWLFVHHPKRLKEVAENEYLESRIQQSQQHELGTHANVRRDQISMDGFCRAIEEFYKDALGCGETCIVNILNRSQGTQLVSVHAKDLASLNLEFQGNNLIQRVGCPNIHMALEYSPKTGVVRTIIRGGARYHDMLAHTFAEHLLGVKVAARRIPLPTLDLSPLRLGFHAVTAMEDGFVSLQVKSITVMSPDAGLKNEFTAMASHKSRCVTDLVAANFPNDNPLAAQWTVSAVTIHLTYAPSPGKQPAKPVVVQVTRRGRLNLHKYDDKLRTQLEGYLVEAGVMRANQTLDMNEQAMPGIEVEQEEWFEQ